VPRLLMLMITDAASTPSLEQATSCMYSMAREHMDSKNALVKVGALRALTSLLAHDSKQCQLNSCATLYAISCAGREVCRQLASFKPLDRLTTLVNPGTGRSAQDDQLQLFSALLIVNLLHVKGVTSKEERAALASSLQRAYDDATETQVRETIAMGLRRLSKMGSRGARLKQGMASIASGLKRESKQLDPSRGTSAGRPASSSMQGYGSASSVDTRAPRTSSASASGKAAAKAALSTMRGVFSSKRGGGGYQGSDSASWQD